MCVLAFACMAGGSVAVADASAGSAGMLAVVAGDGNSGLPTPGRATSSRLASPIDVASDAAGDLYIADSMAAVVEKVTPSGTLSIVAGRLGHAGPPTPGPATSSDLSDPAAVAVDGHGDIYIADQINSLVEKVTPTGTLSIIAGDGGGAAPTPGPATSSDLQPFGLAVDGSGNVYIADDWETDTATGANILKVTPSGTLSIFAGTGLIGSPTPGPATSSKLNFPEGLAIDGSGNLYFSDVYANVIAGVTPSGTLSIVAGNGTQGGPVAGPATSSPLNNPGGIAVDGRGNLYIANVGNNDVLAVSPSEKLSVFAGTGTAGPPTAGPAIASDLRSPYGVAVDGSRNVYVADSQNADVEEVFSGVTSPPATVPVDTAVPVLGGRASSGSTLTCSRGTWTNAPTSFSFRWLRNGVPIPGATGSTYVVRLADENQFLSCVVIASNSRGAGKRAMSRGVHIGFTKAHCPVPSGSISGTHLGPLALGMTQQRARALLPRYTVQKFQFDDFCLHARFGIRAKYADSVLLKSAPAGLAGKTRGRIVIALTSRGHYRLEGVKSGNSLAANARRLHVGKRLRVGKNDWYLLPFDAQADGVLKVRGDKIVEIGIADKRFLATAKAKRHFFFKFVKG